MIRDNYSCWFILNFLFVCLFARFSNTLDIYTNMVNGPENIFFTFNISVSCHHIWWIACQNKMKQEEKIRGQIYRVQNHWNWINIQLLTFFIFLSFGTWIKPRCRHQSSYLGWMDGPQLHITTTVISWISKHIHTHAVNWTNSFNHWSNASKQNSKSKKKKNSFI